MSLPVIAGLFIVLTASQLPGATFTASAGGCGFQTNTAIDAAVEAIVTDRACIGSLTGDIDSAYARSGPAGLGASADHLHTCCDTATGAGGTAEAQTEFMITGPAGAVTVSLNLALTGSVGGGVGPDFRESMIRIDAFVGPLWAIGIYSERVDAGALNYVQLGALAIPGGLCPTVCILPTLDVTVLTNVWIPLTLRLSASAGGGTGDNNGWADASHTLYFPLDGPVFNLPDGRYSAEIAGMNVAGNRVIREDEPVGDVPEPSSYAMFGAGLAALSVLRRKK